MPQEKLTISAYGPFQVLDEIDRDGVLRLVVQGELDLATGEPLKGRLRSATEDSGHIRLDLSQLEFIDSRGIQAVLEIMRDADRDGCSLEIMPGTTRQVGRVIELTRTAPLLWPGE